MVYWIASYNNENLIKRAVNKSNMVQVDSMTNIKIDFATFAKKRIGIYSSIDVLIIDVSAVITNTLLPGIKNWQMVYDELQIIVYAPGITKEDDLYHNLVEHGIYDICAIEDEEELIRLMRVGNGRSEDIIFNAPIIACEPTLELDEPQVEDADFDSEPEKKRKEESVPKAQEPVTIGIYGTMIRIGCTLNAIYLAESLKSINKSVLVNLMDQNTYEDLKAGYETSEQSEGVFELNGITFTYNPKKIGESYDYIIIDYGTYHYPDTIGAESINILITGAKAWEFKNLGKIIESHGIDITQYLHIITFAAKNDREDINSVLIGAKVFYPDYIEDPFNPDDMQKAAMLGFIRSVLNEE